MLDVSLKALVERRPEVAAEVPYMEEESDRLYWLIVRQLLLAIRDPSTVSKMGIQSPLHIVGNRAVAKTLEEMADSAENIANEVSALKDREIISSIIMSDIAKFSNQVTKISEQSFRAFLSGEIHLANEAMEMIQTAYDDEGRLTQKVLTHVKDASAAASLRIIIRNLSQIAKYSKIIGEVATNRIVEKPSEICEYTPLQQRQTK
jgi:phosphate uptake regulator